MCMLLFLHVIIFNRKCQLVAISCQKELTFTTDGATCTPALMCYEMHAEKSRWTASAQSH